MPKIERYAVRFHGGPTGSGKGVRAQIHCFDANNKMVGWIDFFDVGFHPAKDKLDGAWIVMGMQMNALESVIDVLRNESPVFLQWQEHTKNAYLGTSQEPVGEGENLLQ